MLTSGSCYFSLSRAIQKVGSLSVLRRPGFCRLSSLPGSHSLFLAVTLWSFAVLIGQRYASRLPEALAMALISHTVLDFLCTQFGKGAALLWPITSTRYRLGWMGLPENLTWYSWSNYWEWISLELLLFLLPAIWLVLWRWKQGAVLDNKKGLDPEENTNN